jgi:hypothetical protein
MAWTAVPRQAGLGSASSIDGAQVEDRLGIELIRIGAEPVERGHGNVHPPLIGRGMGCGRG